MARAITHRSVVNMMQREIIRLGSQRAYARAAGVSVQYVSDILLGRRKPGPAIARHHQLTYRVVVRYERTYTRP